MKLRKILAGIFTHLFYLSITVIAGYTAGVLLYGLIQTTFCR